MHVILLFDFSNREEEFPGATQLHLAVDRVYTILHRTSLQHIFLRVAIRT